MDCIPEGTMAVVLVGLRGEGKSTLGLALLNTFGGTLYDVEFSDDVLDDAMAQAAAGHRVIVTMSHLFGGKIRNYFHTVPTVVLMARRAWNACFGARQGHVAVDALWGWLRVDFSIMGTPTVLQDVSDQASALCGH
jgi:ABC-type hemin transport system ATPase subunit